MSIKVGVLVRYLKNKLDTDTKLQNVEVSGEISNFRMAISGHFYFTLKDENGAIPCVIFASKAKNLSFKPENGQEVIVKASVSIFENTGTLQLYVTSIRKSGIGDLFIRYEELKQRLGSEGYFDDNHKKQLKTKYLKKVAILVGKDSAAMSDIEICFQRRWPLCQRDYYPVLVQGNEAAGDIIANLKVVDDLDYDLIILARGGGSFEDLFCFNDENLIKCIFNLKTFIITGIGHEQDFTLSDFVADMRSATPTAAVELVTNNIDDVCDYLKDTKDYLINLLKNKTNNYQNDLSNIKNSSCFTNPERLVDNYRIRLDYYYSLLEKSALRGQNMIGDIDIIASRLRHAINIKILNTQQAIDVISNKLKAYNIDDTLKRGYSIIYKDNRIINDINELNDDLLIRMANGTKQVKVREE